MRSEKGKHEKAKQQPKSHDVEQKPDKEHGEGNYKATRQYDDATKEFVKSGQVEDAASKASPRNPQEKEEMENAERAGREKSKGEDPQLYQNTRKPADRD